MPNLPNDFDGSERDWIRDPLCPPHDLLLAAAADVLPEAVARPILDHLSTCQPCQTLVADLTSQELASPTQVEAGRIDALLRARIRGARNPAGNPFAWLRWQLWVPSLTALAGL